MGMRVITLRIRIIRIIIVGGGIGVRIGDPETGIPITGIGGTGGHGGC